MATTATRFRNNWACKKIAKLVSQPNPDAGKIAEILATQPEFLAAIQAGIDARKAPGYDPKAPGNDPAQAVIGNLIEALSAPGDMG